MQEMSSISEQLAALLQNLWAKLAILTNFWRANYYRGTLILKIFGTTNKLATAEMYFWFNSDH